jgi:hypothetical protein
MFGINLRELALVAVAVAFLFGGTVGGFYLPPAYRDTLLIVWYAGSLVVLTFLIVRWFIRRRRH